MARIKKGGITPPKGVHLLLTGASSWVTPRERTMYLIMAFTDVRVVLLSRLWDEAQDGIGYPGSRSVRQQ
jgi:hypothetical protein